MLYAASERSRLELNTKSAMVTFFHLIHLVILWYLRPNREGMQLGWGRSWVCILSSELLSKTIDNLSCLSFRYQKMSIQNILLTLSGPGGGGLRGPDGQTHSCQSETSYPMMPKLGDF